MTTINKKQSVVEMPGELGKSCLMGRVAFLKWIQVLRPHVLSDLWDTCMFEYQCAIVGHFGKQIIEGLDDPNEYFQTKQAEFEKAPNESPNPMVARIQQKLSPGGPGSSPTLVRTYFRLWALLTGNETVALREAILKWSKRWNLNNDWCRDHALTVLQEWLFHDFFKWLHITPHSKESLQMTGWSLALHEIEADAILGQVLADEQLHGSGKNPEVFRFRSEGWLADAFAIDWNATDESEVEFKKRALVNFRISLDQVELHRLRPLAANDAERRRLHARQFKKELAWRNGILRKFETQLQGYVEKMVQQRQEAKRGQTVVEAPSLVKDEAFKWLVLYQVPDENNRCLAYLKIKKAEATDLTEVRVRQCIKAAADLIDLQLHEPSLNAGRRRSSVDSNPSRK